MRKITFRRQNDEMNRGGDKFTKADLANADSGYACVGSRQSPEDFNTALLIGALPSCSCQAETVPLKPPASLMHT